jgi:hypothetical protein
MNQVAKDVELLDVAKDCFQFLTKFFEVISVSAAHIYHSALELCPVSSIIRKLYYHQHIACSPKVVFGTPESWAQTIGISSKDRYNGLCIWSPCGRFVAAQTGKAVEIRNQLTLELITILQSTEMVPHLTGPLAYSPDGLSIACASNTAIIIWDIQTGGVAKEIKCSANNISLVWSSDGQVLCTVSPEDQMSFIIHMYNISSGTASSPGTLRSRENPHLWMHNEAFWVMTIAQEICYDPVHTFKVGSTLTKIQSFPPPLSNIKISSFSPATHNISILANNGLHIVDIQKSKHLLDETGYLLSHSCFSSNGNLFAASQGKTVDIWEYGSNHYTMWGGFQCPDVPKSLQFSPTSLSILGHSGDILQVWHLHKDPTALQKKCQQYVGLSCSGAYIVTAYNLGNTVTISNLLTQAPSQFINTDLGIESLGEKVLG